MPLTKEQIIEIQESAQFNVMRRLREQEEKKELAERVKQRVEESKTTPVAKQVVADKELDKKGK